MDAPHRTTVGELTTQFDLPDPTVPVPFERFASLKDSEDMLHRAAFWALYTAWILDKKGKDTPAHLAIEARNDAHIFQSIYQQLDIRDCMLITRRELDVLEQEREDNIARVSGSITAIWVGAAFVLGMIVSWLLGVAF